MASKFQLTALVTAGVSIDRGFLMTFENGYEARVNWGTEADCELNIHNGKSKLVGQDLSTPSKDAEISAKDEFGQKVLFEQTNGKWKESRGQRDADDVATFLFRLSLLPRARQGEYVKLTKKYAPLYRAKF